jgi:TPP-dependent pyruvate/acetoin dehydrogenase alpha subunit
VLQNNQVALGTRLSQHHKAERFRDWGRAYGVELLEADGNNVLDMYAAGRLAVDRCRRGDGPVFIAAETFRMGGHATHDVREARALMPPELFETWGQRDPVGLYEEFLATGPWELASEVAEGSVGADSEREDRNRRVLSDIESELAAEVDAAAGKALESRDRETIATMEDTDADVYA